MSCLLCISFENYFIETKSQERPQILPIENAEKFLLVFFCDFYDSCIFADNKKKRSGNTPAFS